MPRFFRSAAAVSAASLSWPAPAPVITMPLPVSAIAVAVRRGGGGGGGGSLGTVCDCRVHEPRVETLCSMSCGDAWVFGKRE